MNQLIKDDSVIEWAELKQIFRTHWVLSACSVVFLLAGLTELILPQFSLGPWPRLDVWVGSLMDKSFIGSGMTWLVNAAAHTPDETYEFAKFHSTAHIMFRLGMAVAAVVMLLWWAYIILWVHRKPQTGKPSLGIS
jgi:hypothetical protein